MSFESFKNFVDGLQKQYLDDLQKQKDEYEVLIKKKDEGIKKREQSLNDQLKHRNDEFAKHGGEQMAKIVELQNQVVRIPGLLEEIKNLKLKSCMLKATDKCQFDDKKVAPKKV
jgi:hypothetical protein